VTDQISFLSSDQCVDICLANYTTGFNEISKVDQSLQVGNGEFRLGFIIRDNVSLLRVQ
jgi:hypothetical protein